MQAEGNNGRATLTPGCQEVGNVRYSVRLRPTQVRPDDPVERVAWYDVRLGDWVASYRLVPHDGRAIIGEIRLLPYEEGSRAGEWSGDPESAKGGIRSEIARQLVTERTLEEVRSIFEAQVDTGNGWALPRFGFDPGAATDVIPRPQRRSDRWYAGNVAKPYADAKRQGNRRVRLAVAEHCQCSPHYASKLIREAKDRELLTEDGELTDTARELPPGTAK